MRRTAFLLLTLALLTVPVCAVQLPGELLDALPEEAAALAEGEGITEGGVWLLVQSFFDALRRIINARFAHMADKYALEGNTKGIRNCAIWWPLAMNIVTKFPFMFVAVYYGTTVIDKLVDVLPAWVMTGFSVAGGMMPAIGFAILINVIGKRSILPFFFIGFFIVKIFGCSALQLACLGIPMAIAIVLMTKDSEDATVKRALAATASDDDDDE